MQDNNIETVEVQPATGTSPVHIGILPPSDRPPALTRNCGSLLAAFLQLRQKTAESVLMMGEIVVEAKQTLSKTEYLGRFQTGAKLNGSKLRKYECIGHYAGIFREHLESLPHCWTTLYKLTTLPEHRLVSAFNAGVIRPHMTGNEFDQIFNADKARACSKCNKDADQDFLESLATPSDGFVICLFLGGDTAPKHCEDLKSLAAHYCNEAGLTLKITCTPIGYSDTSELQLEDSEL